MKLTIILNFFESMYAYNTLKLLTWTKVNRGVTLTIC